MFSIAKVKRYFNGLLIRYRRTSNVIRLNRSDRTLSQRRIVFHLKSKASEEYYVVSGRLCSFENIIDKAAILAVNFFDIHNKKIEMGGGILEFSKSVKYGNYRYIGASSAGQRFHVLVSAPIGTNILKLEIFAKQGVESTLLAGTIVERGNLVKVNDLAALISLIDLFVSGLRGAVAECDVESLSLHLGSLRRYQENPLIMTKAFEYYANGDFDIAPIVGWLAYRALPEVRIANWVQKLLTKQGHLYKLKSFVDEVSLVPPVGWKHTSRRIDNDILRLNLGFEMPVKNAIKNYQPSAKVLYLLHNSLPYNSGGYATRTHGLLTGINSFGDVKVYAVSRPGYPSDHRKHISSPLPATIPFADTIDGVEYLRCNQKIRRSSLTLDEYVAVYAEELRQVAIDRNISIIHAASNYPNGLAAILAARQLGISSVYEVRGLWEVTRMSRQVGWENTDQFRFMAKMETEACHNADRVIVITAALKNLMVERGVDSRKITIVPNCVHADLFTPSSERDRELEARLKIASDDVVIGYVGSLVNYEGLKDLIRATRLLLDKERSNFKLLLVGDGAMLGELKDLVGLLKLETHVIFTGRVPHSEVHRYYSLIDIAPFPREPFLVCEIVSPLKPFEALACGKAVLVSSCAALVEIIQNGITGLVFDKGNYVDLASKLQLLIENEQLRNDLGRQGREWVVSTHDWKKNAASIVTSIYKDLI